MKLGYACINKGLSEQPKSKRITTNRTMRRATFEEKGLAYASEVFLQNSHDLMKILQWNEQHNLAKHKGLKRDGLEEHNFSNQGFGDTSCMTNCC